MMAEIDGVLVVWMALLLNYFLTANNLTKNGNNHLIKLKNV